MIQYYIAITPPQNNNRKWYWAILWATEEDAWCDELYQTFSRGEVNCAQEAILASVEELKRFKKEYCIK